MRNKLILVVALFCISLSCYGINVSVATQMFRNDNQSYIEIYSRIISDSVQYASEDTASQQSHASIEYTIIFKQADSIVIADRYKINSPTLATKKDFFDLKRFSLQDGEYAIDLQYVDLNNITDTLLYSEIITVESHPNKVQVSDVLLMPAVENSNNNYSYEKSGFFYEPLCYDLVGKEQQNLHMYIELYNQEKILDEEFYIKYYPIDIDATAAIDNQIPAAYKKMTPDKSSAVLLNYDCSNLGSGNYVMYVEVHKKDKTLVAQVEKTFSVYHPLVDYKILYEGDKVFETSFVQFLDEESVEYGLKAIYPRVGNHMTETLNQIISSKDIRSKRYFLFSYWNNFSDDPKAIYDQYMEVAKAIDLRYANNVGHGFESDRGYYFLKYGRPDNIVSVEDEPSAPPYEIWIYNYMPETQETNVRFLFYNPSLVANDYQLLHSTCRGERHNPRWEVDLYFDDNLGGQNENYLDARTTEDNFNRNAKRYFSDM